MEPPDMRIVLLGKTGAGKSSLAETVFGERVFEINHTSDPGTSQCQTATGEVHGRNVTMIDTPGFFDHRTTEDSLRSNIARCIIECSPGPHAFIILLKVEKFAAQENEIISEIIKAFSEEAFRYSVVVFTHGDQLPEGMQIEEFIGENAALRKLLERCERSCHVVDNKYWNNNQQDEYRNNQRQVENLLNTITEMMNQNNGGCYTNDMLKAVEEKTHKEAKHIQSSSPNMSWEDIIIMAKNKVYDVLKNAAAITTGMFLGALLGVPVMVAKVVAALNGKGILSDTEKCIAGASAGTGETVGVLEAEDAAAAAASETVAAAVRGGVIGHREAVKADSIKKAVSNTADAVTKEAKEQIKMVFYTSKENEKKSL